MSSHCYVGVCSSPVHCKEIEHCFSTPQRELRQSVPRTGSPEARFTYLMDELEKRFPHPNPFDSTKSPEQYMLEAIDKLIGESKHGC